MSILRFRNVKPLTNEVLDGVLLHELAIPPNLCPDPRFDYSDRLVLNLPNTFSGQMENLPDLL